MKYYDGIPVFGKPDPGALSQIQTCRKTAVHAALMADNHKGYSVPIGGVVAYRDAISPSGVGYDIGCGNKAVLLDVPAAEVKANIKTIMDDVFRIISFGVGRSNDEKVEHPIFDKDHPGWEIKEINSLKRMAQSQLGTVGSGNHYVDIFEDDISRIWVGVHFGSRGLGHKIATYFLRQAGASDGMDVPPCVLSLDTCLGTDYISAMNLAGEYAYAGRDWVCARMAKLLGASIKGEVHNHHNFAWKERHYGEDLWVVRKGATPAFPGQLGFVGGSMADDAVIIQGRWIADGMDAEAEDRQAASLFSTVHGAGRVMGRLEAKGKYKKGVCIRPGRITQQEMDKWVHYWGVELRGAGLDEAPQAYKRLPEVLYAHEGTIETLRTLRPIGVAMAGAKEFDPYKD